MLWRVLLWLALVGGAPALAQVGAAPPRPAMMVQHPTGFPQPDAFVPHADMWIKVTGPELLPAVGGDAVFQLVIGNKGPNAAREVNVIVAAKNMRIGSVSGACRAVPCLITTAAPGVNNVIVVQLRIAAGAASEFRAFVRAATADPNFANNVAEVSDPAPATGAEPPPPLPVVPVQGPQPVVPPPPPVAVGPAQGPASQPVAPPPVANPTNQGNGPAEGLETNTIKYPVPPPSGHHWMLWLIGGAVLVALAISLARGIWPTPRWPLPVEVTAALAADVAGQMTAIGAAGPGMTLTAWCEMADARCLGALTILQVAHHD